MLRTPQRCGHPAPSDAFLVVVEITGNPNAVMQYVNYEEAIVQRYGIELQGWTYKKLVNPSELSTAVGPLQRLLDAIKGGDCKFIKLTAEERWKCLEAYKKKITSGELKVQDRKVRSDAGIRKGKRKRAVSKESDEEEEKDEEDEDEDE
jgi:hypothetical protein